MACELVVCREAGDYGVGPEPEQVLGRWSLPQEPQPGQILLLGDDEWLVTVVTPERCLVRPRTLRGVQLIALGRV